MSLLLLWTICCYLSIWYAMASSFNKNSTPAASSMKISELITNALRKLFVNLPSHTVQHSTITKRNFGHLLISCLVNHGGKTEEDVDPLVRM